MARPIRARGQPNPFQIHRSDARSCCLLRPAGVGVSVGFVAVAGCLSACDYIVECVDQYFGYLLVICRLVVRRRVPYGTVVAVDVASVLLLTLGTDVYIGPNMCFSSKIVEKYTEPAGPDGCEQLHV